MLKCFPMLLSWFRCKFNDTAHRKGNVQSCSSRYGIASQLQTGRTLDQHT